MRKPIGAGGLLAIAGLAAATPMTTGARPAIAPRQGMVEGGTADPLAWIRGIYARGATPGADFRGYSHDAIFSPRLRAMFADDEAYAKGEVGRLEVNPFTGAQDDEITGLTVTAAPVDGAPRRRVVTARFRNIGHPTTIVFYFTRIGRRWYIDDIAGKAADGQAWTLSLVLLYGG